MCMGIGVDVHSISLSSINSSYLLCSAFRLFDVFCCVIVSLFGCLYPAFIFLPSLTSYFLPFTVCILLVWFLSYPLMHGMGGLLSDKQKRAA